MLDNDKELTNKTIITKEEFEKDCDLLKYSLGIIFGFKKCINNIIPLINADNDNHLTDIVIVVKCDKSNIHISDVKESDSDVI